MLVLGIETSTSRTSVAIGNEFELVASWQLGRGPASDRSLMGGIKSLLDSTSLRFSDLSGVSVGLGPGRFTGLRVGLATGKAIAQTLSIPIAGISSLDALAYSVRHARTEICVCMDARRKEVVWSFYRTVPGGVQRLKEFRCADPIHCINEIEARGEHVLVVGDGPYSFADEFNRHKYAEIAGPSEATPTAIPLVSLAARRFEREDSDRITELVPLYVRKTDAEINLGGQ